MTLGTRIGLGAAAVVLLMAAGALWYARAHPLSLYATMNRRALGRAGLAETRVASPLGPQAFWSGGTGPTLVLLHGAGDAAGTYAKVVEKLTPNHRLVIPDLAGHGRSAPAEGPISVGDVIAGLEAVMAQGPQDRAILVGNSLGAWAALLYAHRHPGRVARVVLVNGGALTGERQDISLIPRSREEAAALMTQLRDPSSGPVPGFLLDDVVRTAASGPLARIAATASGMHEYVLDGRLQEVQAPVDLLWGASDQLFPLTYARRMMDALPASRLTTIPACGHVPQQECPGRFASALLEVLRMPAPQPASGAAGAERTTEAAGAPPAGPGR